MRLEGVAKRLHEGYLIPHLQSLFFCLGIISMYLCYVDESGTPDIPGNTSHYILSGLAIPVENWKDCEYEINLVKNKYNLKDAEIHTAWILRKYHEQILIKNFDALSLIKRRNEVESYRKTELYRLQKLKDKKAYHQTKKNYQKTQAYIHLSYSERLNFMNEIADKISNWGHVRLFAECINKILFNPSAQKRSVDEQALEQLVSRFEKYLSTCITVPRYGILIHDNNETVSKKHTALMKSFHEHGTLWVGVSHIIETPLFVNSELTSMIQIADVCSYGLRRYLENHETNLFDKIFKRADKKNGVCVGIRHFTDNSCTCLICQSHKKIASVSSSK